MLKVHYDPYGRAISDWQVSIEAKLLVDRLKAEPDNDIPFYYSTSNIFTRLRLAVVEGEIPHSQILFYFKGESLKVNRYGAIKEWPDGFCDYEMRMAESIFKESIALRKAEKSWPGC